MVEFSLPKYTSSPLYVTVTFLSPAGNPGMDTENLPSVIPTVFSNSTSVPLLITIVTLPVAPVVTVMFNVPSSPS